MIALLGSLYGFQETANASATDRAQQMHDNWIACGDAYIGFGKVSAYSNCLSAAFTACTVILIFVLLPDSEFWNARLLKSGDLVRIAGIYGLLQ